MDIKEEFNLKKLLIIKKELSDNLKKLSKISSNEEYERKSFEYYNNLSDLNSNKVYDKYLQSSIHALRAGYKFGVDDLSMGFFEIEKRMPLLLNEETYLIRHIQKETGYKIKSELERKILMEIYIHFYKKCLRENGERFIAIDLEPLPYLERLEKNNFIESILSTEKVA